MHPRKIVCFLDFLGFKNIIEEASKNLDTNIVDSLRHAFNEIEAEVRNQFDVRFFSDSITLSCEIDAREFDELCSVVATIQSKLIKEEFLTRGGISFGMHHSEGNFLFSEGLVNAYLIESKQANFPRVIVSKDLLDIFAGHPHTLIRERDGSSFVDYFSLLLEGDKNSIETQYLRYRKDIIFSDKYLWLAEYWNYKFPNSKIEIESRFSA